jgi:hypothetical protein
MCDMSSIMKRALLAMVLVACGGGAEVPANAPVNALVQAPAPVDTRNAGQVVVDILGTLGYACTAGDMSWSCAVPPGQTDPEPLSVSFTDDGANTRIYFETFRKRAFAKPCAQFVDHMNDLANPGDAFDVTCDDSSQTFRLRTTFNYYDTDVAAWINAHRVNRASSLALLKKSHALR